VTDWPESTNPKMIALLFERYPAPPITRRLKAYDAPPRKLKPHGGETRLPWHPRAPRARVEAAS
jgi:hypothetical protein